MIFGYIDPGTGFTITTVGGMMLALLSGMLGVVLLFLKRIFNFFRKHLGWVIIALLCIAAGVTVFFANKMNSAQSNFHDKIVIIGFDALSPRIMEPLMAQGRLPNFARLKDQGGYTPLATTNPPQSPVAWSSFITGQNPGKTGVFDFIARDPKTYGLSLSLAEFEAGKVKAVIKSKRFWQYTSGRKVPATIISCPITFPPDRITGKMLSGMGVTDVLGTEGTFSFYTTEKEPERESTGGKVFYLNKSPMMISHLIGPKVSGAGGKADNVRVPFKASVKDGQATVEFQGRTAQLKVGEWSDWQEVTFDLGLFKKAKGIFKFYLVEAEPEFKLYAGPINMDPRDPLFKISYPDRYSREIAETIGLYHTQGMPFDTWGLNENRIDEEAFIAQLEDIHKENMALLEHELAQFREGIFFFYFESSDIVQHMFWRYTDPQHPLYEPDAPARYKNMITEWYIKMDEALGRVMQNIGKDDTLLVLSDHGFDTFRRAVNVNTWLRDNGYLELEDAGAIAGQPLLKGIDWARTKAYAVGFGGIYINEKGREKEGVVNPGSEKEQLKTEIIQKLEEWADAKYSARVVHKAHRQQEAFWGPYQADAPDILVGYNIGYDASWQTALGDVPKNQIEDNLKKWSGSHLFDNTLVPGVLFTNRPLAKDNPSIMDLAPTILSIVGFGEDELKEGNFDGTPLFR